MVRERKLVKTLFLWLGDICQMSVSFNFYLFFFPTLYYSFTLSCRNDFPNEKIPTLREAVAECLNHNLTIFFDVKGHAYKVQFIP